MINVLLRIRRLIRRYRRILLALGVLLLIWYAFCLPKELFQAPTSTIVVDSKGELLAAMISEDGQWHFPPSNNIPEKYEEAVIEFEDRNFYRHIGVSARGMGRAIVQNIKNGRVVSGGSTISMQVIRMHRQRTGRSIWDKVYEMILATRLEIRYSKKEIFELYAANAPFGGNVVGLDAASWRYFGNKSQSLTWAQAATLAVLPNAPSLMHPGRNRDALKAKRDRLLKRLWEKGKMDDLDYELAVSEPLPGNPLALPSESYHLLQDAVINGRRGERIVTDVDPGLQRRLNRIAAYHYERNSQNEIHNLAVLVLDVKTGNTIGYLGNSPCPSEHHSAVDMIRAERSTGSILKPFLYAHRLEEGEVSPSMLLLDVPTRISGYSPENYDKKYDGMVRADEALARSLNVPAVRQLMDHGVGRFKSELEAMGMQTLHRPASEYGLSLILGGAEATLWDLAHMYASMGAKLQGTKWTQREYSAGALSPGSIYLTFQAMTRVQRPGLEGNWAMFENNRRVAWKTGTSFGARDAWAIGVTPEYVVAVWVGNADGEGRPGLSGFSYAAPLLFEVFNSLGPSTWFERPERHMERFTLCSKSGYRKGSDCDKGVEVWLPKSANTLPACPYHKIVHLNAEGTKRVRSTCYDVWKMKHVSRMIIPPLAEKYFVLHHPDHIPLEPMSEACSGEETKTMELVYPLPNATIFIPLTQEGERGEAVFEAVHKQKDAVIYWHLDEEYLGKTQYFHQLEVHPPAGKHVLLITDQEGNSITRKFTILQEG